MKPCRQSLGLLAFVILVAACNPGPLGPGNSPEDQPIFASKPVGPVTINTVINFSGFPFSGTFTVSEGSGLLGCSAGTFVDIPAGGLSAGAIRKTFTCTAGANSGSTFTAIFRPTPAPGPGQANGHWEILSGTGAFAGLRGQGDFSVVFSETDPVGFETLTGTIHFEP
jgi:hypothetical protein